MSTTTLETAVSLTPQSQLAERWLALRAQEPALRIFDAAAKLGVSELELRALETATTRMLRPDWPALFEGLQTLGRVMALTRNRDAVHERRGVYTTASFFGPMGQVNGADIDLRMLMHSWAYLVAVQEQSPHGPRRSFQIFDKHGLAVHKVHLIEDSNVEAYSALVSALSKDAPGLDTITVTPAPSRAFTPREDFAAEPFLTEWELLKDTHEFFGLLKRHNVPRLQAMRVAEGRFTRKLDTTVLEPMLKAAAGSALPIMVFVGNPGMIQIHCGPVQKIVKGGKWLNVLDENFNLHVNEEAIYEIWSVVKPTSEGMVTSVEAYDTDGELIVYFFGLRKPGQPEREEWRTLVAGLAGAEK